MTHKHRAFWLEIGGAARDSEFCEELEAIKNWFNVLSEGERGRSMLSLMENFSEADLRFFYWTLAEQLGERRPRPMILT